MTLNTPDISVLAFLMQTHHKIDFSINALQRKVCTNTGRMACAHFYSSSPCTHITWKTNPKTCNSEELRAVSSKARNLIHSTGCPGHLTLVLGYGTASVK